MLRGLGWDIDSRYSGPRGKWFPAGASFGHTGWTGTSLWIDPTSRSFMIFLANRVHPDGKGDVTPIYTHWPTVIPSHLVTPRILFGDAR